MPRTKGTLVLLVGIVVGFVGGYSYALGSVPQHPPPVSGKTSVVVLNDRDFYPFLITWVDRANESIHIIMYSFKSDTEPVSRLLELLVSKARRGVDVKVVLENTVEYNEYTHRRLLDAGIPVRFDSRSHLTHNKVVIIDGKVVLVGSHNWSYSAFMRNHETSVAVFDTSTATLMEKYFNEVWSRG